MASEPAGKTTSKSGRPRMSSDYGQRAAFALNLCSRGPNSDKLAAQAFRCSDRMVRFLRKGMFWTTDRLNQASAAFRHFDAYLAAPDQLHTRIDEIEQELADLRSLLRGEDDER